MKRPFEVDAEELQTHLNDMVSLTFADLQSQLLVLPKGSGFIDYPDFQDAYEVLKRHTAAFANFTEATTWVALREDSLCLVVLRAILGMSPPEWAELARTERAIDVPQGMARDLDRRCRAQRTFLATLIRPRHASALNRIEALVSVAVQYIVQGAPTSSIDMVHRLAKVDTDHGLHSLQYVAAQHIPYAVLLYERYLGRPFASHRDAVSELVGEVMGNAIEDLLLRAKISYRRTKRAERIPGYDQAPDFFVPDEYNPAVLIEAKITGDDGTARDKATRLVHLAEMRDARLRAGRSGFQVVACLDGRGFGVRRADMERILRSTEGKVFTLATLDQIIAHTELRRFLPESMTSS